MKIKIKKFSESCILPTMGSIGAGAFDVYADYIISLEQDLVKYTLGFGVQLPKGYRLTLVPRSSFTKTKWVLQNSPGLVDEDFTGEISFVMRAIPYTLSEIQNGNEGYPILPYNVGDRIGQMYLEKTIPIEFEEVDELDETDRGSGGYGSTGK